MNISMIPGNMKAIVAYAPGDYRLETVDVPTAGFGEMVIKVEACGICAGDIKAFQGAPSFWGMTNKLLTLKPP